MVQQHCNELPATVTSQHRLLRPRPGLGLVVGHQDELLPEGHQQSQSLLSLERRGEPWRRLNKRLISVIRSSECTIPRLWVRIHARQMLSSYFYRIVRFCPLAKLLSKVSAINLKRLLYTGLHFDSSHYGLHDTKICFGHNMSILPCQILHRSSWISSRINVAVYCPLLQTDRNSWIGRVLQPSDPARGTLCWRWKIRRCPFQGCRTSPTSLGADEALENLVQWNAEVEYNLHTSKPLKVLRMK